LRRDLFVPGRKGESEFLGRDENKLGWGKGDLPQCRDLILRGGGRKIEKKIAGKKRDSKGGLFNSPFQSWDTSKIKEKRTA